ncbi:MAG: DinB family protein [Chitinophagales bacterium]
MKKEEIIGILNQKHEEFFLLMQKLPEEIFTTSVHDKWSPHQNLEHIRRSVQPLVLAYKLPKFIIRIVVGKSNRPSRTYDQLVKRYTDRLTVGGRARGRFVPSEKIKISKNEIILQTKKYLQSVSSAVGKNWSEKDLDTFIFPHPLLGKLTAREMLYFTAYHAQHHKEIVEKYYCK